MKLTTKLLSLLFVAMCVFSCSDVSEEDMIVYIAHPEEVKAAKPKNIDYTSKYEQTASDTYVSLRNVKNEAELGNLAADPDNPEQWLKDYWPDRFDNLPNNQGRMGYIEFDRTTNLSYIYIAVCPLGGYVFPNSFKTFKDFLQEQVPEVPKVPDYQAIVDSFPSSHVERSDIEFTSNMDFKTYSNGVTGNVEADQAIYDALDKAQAQFNAECAAWEEKFKKAKTDFFTYVRDVKYAFLNKKTSYYIWGNNTAMKAGDTPMLTSPYPKELPDDIVTKQWGSRWQTPSQEDLCRIMGFQADKYPTKYKRNLSYSKEDHALIIQAVDSNGKARSKKLFLHLDGYMEPDGTIKEDNVTLMLLTRDRANKDYPMVSCFFVDVNENQLGIKNKASINNGYPVIPVRYIRD